MKKENKYKKLYTHCLRCGKVLKSEKARELGYGPVCEHKIVKPSKKLF